MKIGKKGTISFEAGEPILRSCWECNKAHEYLKERKTIHHCFACNRYFMNGRFLEEFKKDVELFDFIRKSQLKEVVNR